MAPKLTPMLKQYFEIKRQVPDAILFYRLGDFYEMFYEDAERAAPLLDLVLTARNRGYAAEAPMCGVPYHAADGYIAKLIKHGLRVAICARDGNGFASHASQLGLAATPVESSMFDPAGSHDYLTKHFGTQSLRGFGLEDDDVRVGAAGGALRYASASHKRTLEHVQTLRVDNDADYLQLDAATLANLEIVESRDAARPRAPLWSVINATRSAMGARTLKRWITRPLKSRDAIFERHDAVDELTRSRAIAEPMTA